VTGASGGVGVAAIQLAIAMGHTVVALSRDAKKHEQLQQLGASATFDPQEPQWRQDLKKTLAPRRVDLAIDNIGGKLLTEVIDTLGDLGRVSVIGGVAVSAYTNAESRAVWQEVLRLLALKGSRPLVDSTFPFDQLPRAFERLAQGPMGKVLLAVKG
jgi:NADPH2:quinone reductase